MRRHIGRLRWLLGAAVLLAGATVHAQGPVENYEVPPTQLPYPLGHPRYENGGFFVTAEFAMFRQDNPLGNQTVARRGFFDTLGVVTKVPGTFVGSNEEALNVQQASGPLTYQPGLQFTMGWRFENGVTVEGSWMHLADAKYSAAASFIPFNNRVGSILENTFLTSDVFNIPPDFLGPDVRLATPTDPPVQVGGATPGIWNGSTFQQIFFVQRFDQGDVTLRIPVYETDCWRCYGLTGARGVIMWEQFRWRTVTFDINGVAGPRDQAVYTNTVSNRLYGPHIGGGTEWYLGTTPIGAFSVSADAEVAVLMDFVKERAKYELGDHSISASRKISTYELSPEVQANVGVWWYPTEAIQVRFGYDLMVFFNTIGSRQPIDFNYGALAPRWNNIPTRFFDGFRFGVGFVF
jgi:hypothetical protein